MNSNVSVVIPTADRQDALLNAIGHVFRQTIPPAEIIVVDNGRNPVVLAELPATVSVIRTPPRIGPSAARNVGARSAKCEYIAFLDDDDEWSPDYLEMALDCFATTGADVVVAQLLRKRTGGSVQPYKIFPADATAQRAVFFRNPGFGGQNILVKKSVFIELDGFDESLPASVDRDFAARLLLAGKKIAVESRATAILCDHGGSRVRGSRHRGNIAFFKKHWRHMTFSELLRALLRLSRRRLALLSS